VSNDNTFPEVGSGDIRRFCQLGPLSRRSEDLWPLLAAMKTPPPAAPSAPAAALSAVHVVMGGGTERGTEGEEGVERCDIILDQRTANTTTTDSLQTPQTPGGGGSALKPETKTETEAETERGTERVTERGTAAECWRAEARGRGGGRGRRDDSASCSDCSSCSEEEEEGGAEEEEAVFFREGQLMEDSSDELLNVRKDTVEWLEEEGEEGEEEGEEGEPSTVCSGANNY
jgi:hypothetical protein